jgi:hypothetical protein
MQGTGGAVIPFERGGANREEIEEAVKLWRRSHDTAEVLSRENLAAMDWKRRMDAQRKALLLALSEYYHKHERADVAPGVLAIITILSDNEKGCATISQPSLALFLGRSESSIRDAQKRLKDDGLITMTRGRFAGSSPVIPSFVADQYNHVTWLISAVNDDVKKPLNLPAPPADCQSEGPAGGLNESAYGAGGMKMLNPPDDGVSIRRGDARQLLSKNSITVDRAAKIAAAVFATSVSALPAAAQPPEPPAIVKSAAISGKELIERLHDAGGQALNLTKPIFHIAEVPRNWMAAGCDLDLDILPTIRAMTANKQPNSIHVWKYFEASVLGARDARKAPLAEARAQKAAWQTGNSSPYKERSLLSDDDPPRKLRPRCEVET